MADTLINQTDSQGRKQGPWEEHGKSFIEKGHYVDGLRQGLWKSYYKDGWGRIKLHSEGDYADGLREGLWKWYDKDGDGLVWISGEGTYHNNLRQGVWKSYYWQGTIESEFHYKDDKMHGICKRFTENEPGEYEYSLYSKDKALISSFLLILPSWLNLL